MRASINLLPQDAGGLGPQSWQPLTAWQILGPLPIGPAAVTSAALPPVLDRVGAGEYGLDPAAMPDVRVVDVAMHLPRTHH